MKSSAVLERSETVERTAQYILATVLWFHVRFDRWPTMIELSRFASYREPDRADAMTWLREVNFLVRDKDEKTGYVVHRVSDEAREYMTPPSMERIELDDADKFGATALPEDEDAAAICSWVMSYCYKNSRWPTPWHFQSCGVHKRDPVAFRGALSYLIDNGRLVQVHIRRGPRKVTRLIDTTLCPQYEGKDGHIYFWSTVAGAFPEP